MKKLQLLIFFQSVIVAALLISGCASSASSETIAVVQASDVEFSTGQRVQVLFGNNGSTRVQPL